MKFLLFIFSAICFFSANGVILKITCRSKGMELTLLKEAIDEWIKETGNQHKVEIVVLPHASNECFALYKQWLSAETFDVDVLLVDIAWIGIFADYFVNLKEFYKPSEIDESDYFDAVLNSMYSGKRIVALPLYTDCGIIYYRADLLSKYEKSVPQTWQELFATAKCIQDEEQKDPKKRNRFYGFVFQAKAFEILTCNFVEVVDSFGGAIIKDDTIVVNSNAVIKATLFLSECLKNISSNSVLNYSEEDARGMFQSGNAVFMRNWPYAWSLLNEPSTAVAGKVGVMAIPPSENGGKTSGVLGGWYLAVSKYSKHKSYAADLIKFLTSKKQQRLRSKYSYMPTFKSLYQDPLVLKTNPFFAHLRDSLRNAVLRPSLEFAKNYTRASTEIFNTINSILTESIESMITERSIRRQLDRLKKRLDIILKKTKNPEQRATEKGFLQKIKEFFDLEKSETIIDKNEIQKSKTQSI